MSQFFGFTVVGLVVGCIYAMAASGLVLTYTTSGIFNFAHGAIGMVMAFAFWDLSENRGWPVPLALVAVLGVIAPLTGALVERFVIRRLRGAPVEVTLVVTLALLLALLYGSYVLWDPTLARPLPRFFGNNAVRILGVNVSYHQLIVVATAVLVAVGLRFVLYRTRTGLAMRAVVDDPELTALTSAEPDRITALSWAMGASLAGLAGVLIAPLTTLDALTLTLLVVNSYAAAMFGRLRSLPLTFAGGIGLGLLFSYGSGYLPQSDFNNRLRDGLPTILLFVVLLVLPAARIRAGGAVSDRRAMRLPSLKASIRNASVFAAGCVLCAAALPEERLGTLGDVLAIGVILLSLVLLTGYGGQVSLCQLTFAGVGALVVGKVGANPFGYGLAVLIAALLGALVALPALRLRGLYLALATLAFARFFETVVFVDPNAFGANTRFAVDRFSLGPLDFSGEKMNFAFLGVVFSAAAVGLLALRRSAFGRRLAAMGDSPAACTTLGIDLTRMKLTVFTISAGLAGLGGALLGGLHTGVSVYDFTMLGSLGLLLVVTLGGIANVSGAILGSATLGVIAALKPSASEEVQRFLDMAPGLTVMLLLARMPDGVAGWLGRQWERVTGEDRGAAGLQSLEADFVGDPGTGFDADPDTGVRPGVLDAAG